MQPILEEQLSQTKVKDTTKEIENIQANCLAKMTAAQRFSKAVALSKLTRQLSLDAIRRSNPELDEQGVILKFIKLNYDIQIRR